jgi:hypothetical protein
LVFTNTPLTSFYSFGSAPVFLDLAKKLDPSGLDKDHLRWIGSSAALLFSLRSARWIFVRVQRESSQLFSPLARGKFLDDLCLACLSIFCFTFLLGSNFNYRLIFLAGTLPKLIEDFDQKGHWRLLIAPVTIMALLWATRLPSVMNHALNWIVYIGACTWLVEAVLSRQPHDVRHVTPLPAVRR